MWLPFLFLPLLALATSGESPSRTQILAAGKAGDRPLLEKALQSGEPLQRRTAIRALGELPQPATDLLIDSARNDSDLLVRRHAIRLLSRSLEGEAWSTFLGECLGDDEALVRLAIVEELAVATPRTREIHTLLERAGKDAVHPVSRTAREALWPYHATVRSVRNQAEYADLSLKEISRHPLPEKGWHFQRDPQQALHLDECFNPDYDDSHWHHAAIGRPWQADGHQYEGVAWYRITFDAPARPEKAEVADLVFGAIDESAWIWLNGEYLGAHDIGVDGWNRTFGVDITAALQWGKPNQLTVRVAKPRGQHGGIWKPVHLEFLSR